jgi:hypothetical protein
VHRGAASRARFAGASVRDGDKRSKLVEFEPAHAAGWSLQSRPSISTLRTHRVRLDERPLERVEEEIHLSALGPSPS